MLWYLYIDSNLTQAQVNRVGVGIVVVVGSGGGGVGVGMEVAAVVMPPQQQAIIMQSINQSGLIRSLQRWSHHII